MTKDTTEQRPACKYDWSDVMVEQHRLKAARITLQALATHADSKTGRGAYPGRALLAKRVGVHPNTIDKHLQMGVDAGLIERTSLGSTDARRDRADEYRLTVPMALTTHSPGCDWSGWLAETDHSQFSSRPLTVSGRPLTVFEPTTHTPGCDPTGITSPSNRPCATGTNSHLSGETQSDARASERESSASPVGESATREEESLSDLGSPSRSAAGSSVVKRGRDTDAEVADATEEFAVSSGQQEQPTTEGESMSEPVWERVGLPSLVEMMAFFWDNYRWVEYNEAGMLARWLAEPGKQEEIRQQVAEWQERTAPKRAYEAAKVEHADYAEDFKAWDRTRLGIGLVGGRRARLVSPEQERDEPPSGHRVLIAYVAARRRGLSAEDLLTRMLALPVGAEDAPEAWDWLDEQQVQPAHQVDDYDDGSLAHDPLTDVPAVAHGWAF